MINFFIVRETMGEFFIYLNMLIVYVQTAKNNYDYYIIEVPDCF